MERFDELLSKAKAKGYKPFHDEKAHEYLEGRITECMFIYVWMTVVLHTILVLVFIEGIEPEKQIDMMIEEIEKIP